MYCLDSEPNMYNLYKYQFFFPHACSLLLRIRISHLQVAPINHPFIHHFIYNLLKGCTSVFFGGVVVVSCFVFPHVSPHKRLCFCPIKISCFCHNYFPPSTVLQVFFSLSPSLLCTPPIFFSSSHFFSPS